MEEVTLSGLPASASCAHLERNRFSCNTLPQVWNFIQDSFRLFLLLDISKFNQANGHAIRVDRLRPLHRIFTSERANDLTGKLTVASACRSRQQTSEDEISQRERFASAISQ